MEYEVKAKIPTSVDSFVRAYLESAEWAGLSDEERQAFEAAEHPHWSADAVSTAIEECDDFRQENAADLELSGLTDEQAGHDFYLTRNRHGAGFWDRRLGEIGARLTYAAHTYRRADVEFLAESEQLNFI